MCVHNPSVYHHRSDIVQLLDNEPENEITLMAFRLLTKDLLDLFAVMNEAVMNVLSA